MCSTLYPQQPAVQTSFTAIWLLPPKIAAHRTKTIIGGKLGVSKDFDQIAIVVDWLDACRAADLEALLDLYAQDASLECACNDRKILRGRADLASYWRPRLGGFPPTAFGLDDITPAAGGVVLDYISFEGKPVRIFFAFDDNGKILQTRCEPSVQSTRP
jgi:hypothetical protein